jgi:pimeloyl-ACP methyl ester carboxylesterase
MPGVAGTANEMQHPLGLFNAEIIGWLIEDNQVAVEVHGAGNRDGRPAWIAASAPANNIPNALVGRLLAELPQEDARKAFEASEIASLLAEKAPDNLASLRGFFSREPQATTAALLQAIAVDGPGVSEAELRNLEIPTLIIGHDIDYIHPHSYAAAISQLIPRSQLVLVTPKAVNKAAYLRDFHTAVSSFLDTFH